MPFDHLRPYALGSLIVLRALVDLAARIRVAAVNPDLAARADRQVDQLVAAAEGTLTGPDHASLREYVAESRAASISTPPARP